MSLRLTHHLPDWRRRRITRGQTSLHLGDVLNVLQRLAEEARTVKRKGVGVAGAEHAQNT